MSGETYVRRSSLGQLILLIDTKLLVEMMRQDVGAGVDNACPLANDLAFLLSLLLSVYVVYQSLVICGTDFLSMIRLVIVFVSSVAVARLVVAAFTRDHRCRQFILEIEVEFS